MPDILSHLNPAQTKAVTHPSGPLLILAGAGAGKTRVLTHRAAWLIQEKGLDPQDLLLVTFTNKAAGEMKHRLTTLLDNQTALPFAGTFHSFAVRILRNSAPILNLSPHFTIFDDQDQRDLLKYLLKTASFDKIISPQLVAWTISQAKNEMISHLEYPEYAKGPTQEKIAQIYIEYQETLKKNQALDFDDLLFFLVRLFQKDKPTLVKYQNLYQHLLIDEWQDTNATQYEIIRLLASRHHQLTAVGDASQSIYAFRGANFRNLMRLKTDFPELTTVELEQNYRSPQTILDAAYAVIKKNTTHPILKLYTHLGQGEKIHLYPARNEMDEADFIITQISLLRPSHPLSDIAILYRTNAQSRVIEEALLHASLPYHLVGGVRFYERKEIKDILAYLRLIANPNDDISLKRAKKIGSRRLNQFNQLDKQALAQKTTLEIMDEITQATRYLDQFDPKVEEDANRLENIKELRSVATNFPHLDDFLEQVALVETVKTSRQTISLTTPDNLPKNDTTGVTLMTIHAAKGLEFPVVFLVGMEEGLFPHSRSLDDKDQLEEERRLCYVAITRTKQKLYLTYATRRLYFGKHLTNAPSQFLFDIPEPLLTLLPTTKPGWFETQDFLYDNDRKSKFTNDEDFNW